MKTPCPIKYELEYIFIASPKLLYTYISTDEGLSEWFADKVIVKDNVFHFYWEGSEEKAIIAEKKDKEFIRFNWMDEDCNKYLEFKIDTSSINSEITLIVTDFAFKEDIKESEMVWDVAIKKMLRIIGGKLVNSNF